VRLWQCHHANGPIMHFLRSASISLRLLAIVVLFGAGLMALVGLQLRNRYDDAINMRSAEM